MGILGVILAVTNLVVVVCMHISFRQYGKYKEHMILGVTLSEEQVKDDEIQCLLEKYRKSFRKYIIIGYITGILVIIPFEWYVSIALILYLVWMFGYIFLIQHIYVKYHKKLYAIKKQKGYTYGKIVNEITIDTKLSYAKDKMPVSPAWFLPSVLVFLIPLFDKGVREVIFFNLQMSCVFIGVIVLVKASYLLIYYMFAKQRSQVYSGNSDINIACNRITKRGYSIVFVVASFFDSISFFVLLWDEIAMGSMTMVGVLLFVVMQCIIVMGMIAGVIQIKKKRESILAEDSQERVVDEDEFWATGFYRNPMDNRLLVPDRQSDMNMTLNMAKPSAWILTAGIGIGTAVLLLWTSVVMLRLDFVPVTYRVADKFEIIAPSYSKTIEFDEIQWVTLLDEFPDIKASKQNGAATDEYALGRFHIRNEGTCYLYIYHGYSPVLELQLNDMKIYCNSREDGVIQECYQQLQEKLSE